MKRLESKTVVITGGTGGIGKATAKRMIKEGAKVLITDLDEEALKKVSEEINSSDLFYIVADVADQKQVKAYAQKARELFGNVDVFFNNAGIEGEGKGWFCHHYLNGSRNEWHSQCVAYVASKYAVNGMMRSAALKDQ